MSPRPDLQPNADELRAIRNRLNPDDAEARLIWNYMARAGYVGETTFGTDNAGAGDILKTMHREGTRAFVLRLAEHVGLSPLNLLKRN